MIIELSPIASNKTSEIIVSAEAITYNGEYYDLGTIPDGGEVQGEAPAIGKIKRVNGVINITLQYEYDANNCTYADRFPEVLDVINGIVKPITGVQNV